MAIRFAIAACVLALAMTTPSWCAQASGPRPLGDPVAGRVLSAAGGHPISRAAVTLVEIRNGSINLTATTDNSGRFRFDRVLPGKYRLTGMARGYTSAAYLAHGQYATAIVTGAGIPTDALDLRLVPVSSIAGRVFDDNGDPVQRATVTLYREDPSEATRVTRVNTIQTEDDGGFEFPRCASGRYYLSVSGTPWYAVPAPADSANGGLPFRAAVDPALDVAFPSIFYPHALSSDEASPIVLQGGEQLHLNLQLHAQRAVTLTLHMPAGDRANQRFPQLTRSVFGKEEPVPAQVDGNGEDRRILGIAPGSYTVQEYASGNGFAASSRKVELGSTSLTMDMAGAADTAAVSVTVHSANGGALPAQLQLSLRDPRSARQTRSKVDDKGVATFANVPPGDYRFVVTNRGREMSVLGVSVEGKAAADRRLHIADAGSVAVELQIAASTALVEGFAKRDGKAAPASMAILVPAGADTDPGLFRRDQTDLDGSFSFANVVPGNYILVAIDDAWDLRWTDLAALTPYLSRGVPVAVPAGSPNHLQIAEAVVAQTR